MNLYKVVRETTTRMTCLIAAESTEEAHECAQGRDWREKEEVFESRDDVVYIPIPERRRYSHDNVDSAHDEDKYGRLCEEFPELLTANT